MIEGIIILILTAIIFIQMYIHKNESDKLQNKILSLIDSSSYRKYKELEVKNLQEQRKLVAAKEKASRKLPFEEYANV